MTVRSIYPTKYRTWITGNDGTRVELRPFLYIQEGDILEFVPKVRDFREVNRLITDRVTRNSRKIAIVPGYSAVEIVEIPPHTFKITFRERQSDSDWQAARFLEQFHYRGKGLNRLLGRRVLLLIDSEKHGVIGYGILSSTVAAARPRFSLFNTNFTKQMRSRLIHQIVRIPRIVVHPEFRGMGLGVLMAKHLCRYASERWDTQGYSPIIVEVIAAMTDYHQFFETAGFVRVGDTEGYDEGIVPLYGKGGWEQRDSASYDFFASKRPKPFLVYPLNDQVTKLVEKRFPETKKDKAVDKRRPLLARSFYFERVSVRYKASDGMSKRAEEVKDSFGVDKHQCSPRF